MFNDVAPFQAQSYSQNIQFCKPGTKVFKLKEALTQEGRGIGA